MLGRRAAIALAIVAGLAGAVAAQDLPPPAGKVNDFAGLLSAEDRTSLGAELDQVERETTAEIAVVTVTTLDGRTVEDYATSLFHTWGIGKADNDNGVLILVAPSERAMRIEVGYGLEGVLPDGLAGALVRETFTPRFRAGDYRAGILEGTARVVEIVRRNEMLTPDPRAALAPAVEGPNDWALGSVLGAIACVCAFGFGVALGARVVVELVTSVVLGGAAIAVAWHIAPPAMVWWLAPLTIALVVLGQRLAQTPTWRRKLRGTGGSEWISQGSDTTGSSSSSSESSGSSFGGGDSGGGGASGHW